MAAPRKTNEILCFDGNDVYVEVRTLQHPHAVTVLDAADVPFMLDGGGRWYAVKNANTLYVARRDKTAATKPRQLLHRLLLAVEDAVVDHMNGDGLDNRRSNIRKATTAQNGRNKTSHAQSTSRFVGVSWRTKGGCWVAQRCGRWLGYFATEDEAARAYNAAVQGDAFARVNVL